MLDVEISLFLIMTIFFNTIYGNYLISKRLAVPMIRILTKDFENIL